MTWYTTKEAASILGKSERTIQHWGKTGKLESKEIAGVGRGGKTRMFFIEENAKMGEKTYARQKATEKHTQKNAKMNEKTYAMDKSAEKRPTNRNSGFCVSANLLRDNENQEKCYQTYAKNENLSVSLNSNSANGLGIKNGLPPSENRVVKCTSQSTSQQNKNGVCLVSVNKNSVLQNTNGIIDLKTTSQLTGWHRNTIDNKISSGKILFEKVKKSSGGYRTLIVVSSLPLEAQEKYKQFLAMQNPDKELSQLTEVQRRFAFAMETILKAWMKFRLEGKQDGLRKQDLDKQFQEKLEYRDILVVETDLVKKFSTKTLYKYLKRWENSGRQTSSLAPDIYSRRGRKTIQSPYFYSFAERWILKQPMVRAKHIYDQLIPAMLREKPDPQIPSYRTFLDFFNTFKKRLGIKIAEEQGKKTLDNLLPYVPRNMDALPGDIVQYDGYIVKNRVTSPYDRHKLVKPVLCYFLDVSTEYIMGYSISFSERSDVIASAWKDLMMKCPAPKVLQPDNPAGIYNAELCAQYIVERENRKKHIKLKQKAIEFTMNNRKGMFFDCGLENIRFVTPGNSKGKKIEPAHYRIFRKYETQPRWADCYIGPDPMQRPEKLSRTDQAIINDKNLDIPTWEFFVSELEKYIDTYNNTKRKDGFTPREAYESLVDVSSRMDSKQVQCLCEWKTIMKPRNGYVKLFDSIFYEHPAFGVLKEGVIIGYDVKNIEELNVYSLDGRKLGGPAIRVKKGSYVDDAKSVEAIKANRRYRKEIINLQGRLLIESDGIKKLNSKQLVTLFNNPKLSALDKTLIEDRMGELEKYPEFNISKGTKANPKHKPIPIDPKIEDAEFEVISDEDFEEMKKYQPDDLVTVDNVLESYVDEVMEEMKKQPDEDSEDDRLFRELGLK